MAIVDEIQAAVRSALPPALGDAIEQNLRAAVSAALERLELVTREEWDIQRAVLARTREKLERMEKQIAELEQRLRPGAAETGDGPR